MKNIYVIASEQRGNYKTTDNPFTETCFSHQNPEFSDVSIAKAVLASASFPYVFCKQKIKGRIFRDGGLTNNYPIEVFDGPNGEPNPATLCLGIDVVKPTLETGIAPPKSKKMEQFKKIANVLWPEYPKTAAVFEKHKKEELEDTRDSPRTILTQVSGDVVDFNLTPDQKRSYFQQGYEKGAEYVAELPAKPPCVVDLSPKPPSLPNIRQNFIGKS